MNNAFTPTRPLPLPDALGRELARESLLMLSSTPLWTSRSLSRSSTSSLVSFLATSIARHSRVNSSTIIRIGRPSEVLSAAKHQLHKWLRRFELICLAIAAQFLGSNRIAIFALTARDGEIRKKVERHYHLVMQSEITSEELAAYNSVGGLRIKLVRLTL